MKHPLKSQQQAEAMLGSVKGEQKDFTPPGVTLEQIDQLADN